MVRTEAPVYFGNPQPFPRAKLSFGGMTSKLSLYVRPELGEPEDTFTRIEFLDTKDSETDAGKTRFPHIDSQS